MMLNLLIFRIKESNIKLNSRDIASDILFEDNHLIVVNKLPSDIVQGDKTGDLTLGDHVKHYLKTKYNKPGEVFLGVIHRLDRPVSGAVIFAKTSKALSRMNLMLKEGKIAKSYHAIVIKNPPSPNAHLENWLIRNEKLNKSFVSKGEQTDAKLAKLNYRLIKSIDRYFLLEVELLTGRHHQIRIQLANIGCIIKGDLKYGAPRSNQNASISLHARHLTFLHPVTKERISIVAPYPKGDIWEKFD